MTARPRGFTTWLLLTLFLGLGRITPVMAAQKVFQAPRVDGVRIDWCLEFGKECGRPAADRFCQRQGLGIALSFEVAHGVGPTLVLGTGQSCAKPDCDGFLKITCEKAQAPTQARDQAAMKDWRYAVLAQGKTIPADAVASPTYNKLLELKSIDVGGFRTARLFVKLGPAGDDGGQGAFAAGAKLRVASFHDTASGSSEYHEADIPVQVTSQVSGWVEIPIIGPELRVIVWGDNLPQIGMTLDCTVYLVK